MTLIYAKDREDVATEIENTTPIIGGNKMLRYEVKTVGEIDEKLI